MKAILLAAGYATRLYPLTENFPKALLPIGGRPIADYILDQIDALPDVDQIYVLSNHKYAGAFADWAKDHALKHKLTVVDDGTANAETRLGAIGDIWFAIEKMHIDDDLLVVAGDNYFTYSLADYEAFFRQKQADCVCVQELPPEENPSRFGIALVDGDGRVTEFEEKPAQPKSRLAVYATYFYQKSTLPRIGQYLAEGNNPDAPGQFPAWLCHKKPVYAYAIDGVCYDIGTHESLQAVDRMLGGGKA